MLLDDFGFERVDSFPTFVRKDLCSENFKVWQVSF